MDFSADWIDWVQWPAMVFTVTAAWLVASTRKTRRNVGFWVFLVSNALWIVWGLHDGGAWALITLQLALAGLNIRGVLKTEVPEPSHSTRAASG
ncbi:hypothetical protein JI739_05985 [Ramlibacter sp. AW1]|uniref:Amino acid transporter n=1 Tax=Ramlibacter aurantiacus TaxID=2801330 RepID=A0A936ZP73_9BURK|nr:hypothetical protein [Ramlibacter aurantiacus]MBL0419891.1 hypothetical protein [Ramlibacter aurantiacus]